jgi:hypothetical protein
MATARLSDSQKQELVRRFRQGESTQALADHFGCSATTITRLVRAELTPEDYAALRGQRQKKAGRDRQIPLAIDADPTSVVSEEPVAGDSSPKDQEEGPEVEAPEDAPAADGRTDLSVDLKEDEEPKGARDGLDELDNDVDTEAVGAKVLAIDDAEDFTDDGDSEDDLLLEGEGDGDGPLDSAAFHPVAVLPIAIDDQHETRPAPWTPDLLPSCAYLLVDKTVELQALPLASIPELGRLPTEEQNLQALVLFTNPRQAKRQCGRTQRVIKVPDPGLLGRTATYLRAQGISRVVIEGALYALPGGH